MPELRADVSQVTSEHLCNSCGACFAACTTGAVQYVETVGGYLFPVIDTEACAHCGLCYAVCPGAGLGKTLSELAPADPFSGKVQSCLIGRATDHEIFSNSQSGGVATALLAHLLATGQVDAAIVAIMAKGVPPRGGVRLVTQPEELKPAQKSKYSPIPLLKALRELPARARRVALVGVACQFHGLYNLQDVLPAYRKLSFYKIGLVCERVMTWAAVDYLGGQATQGPVTNLVWKDKQRDSYPGNPVVYTPDGRQIVLKAAQRMMIKDFFTPARCRLCFDKLNVYADVTLGDPHGIEGVDRERGESMVLLRTERGCRLIAEACRQGKLELREIAAEEAIQGQRMHSKREQWAGYMRAWADMGRTQPSFPFAPPVARASAEQKHWLRHALRLDAFSSRAILLNAAEGWVWRRRIRRAWRWPLGKAKGLLRRVSRGMRA